MPTRRSHDPRFRSRRKKVTSLNINTYMGQSKDVVTLQVQMASLPDGTNFTQQSILNATAKQLAVTTTNSNYQRTRRVLILRDGDA